MVQTKPPDSRRNGIVASPGEYQGRGASFINWEGWWDSKGFFGEAFSCMAPSSAAPVAEATAERAYIRFHGRNRDTWEKRGITANERFNYCYTTEDFKAWESQTGHLTLVQRRGGL